ncbi:MAG: hypothetical protein ACOX6V_03930 [Patescibacteria group bacterium]
MILVIVAGSFYLLGKHNSNKQILSLLQPLPLAENEEREVLTLGFQASPTSLPTTAPVMPNLQQKPSPEPIPSPDTTLSQMPTASLTVDRDITINDVILGIITKNYSLVEQYLAEVVEVNIEQADCCGFLKKQVVIENIKLLDDSQGMWDFSDNEIDLALRSQYPERYGNAVIGITSDGYGIGFTLNEENKVSQLSVIPNYQKFLEESR